MTRNRIRILPGGNPSEPLDDVIVAEYTESVPIEENHRNTENDFRHYTCTLAAHATSGNFGLTTPGSPFYGMTPEGFEDLATAYLSGSLLDYLRPIDHAFAKLEDIDRRSFQGRAYSVMRPKLDTGFSLPNFLLELKDLKFLYKQWIQRPAKLYRARGLADKLGGRKVTKRPSMWGKPMAYKDHPGPSFKDVWRHISEAHLTWAFGLKPLIQDIATIIDKVQHAEQHVRLFLYYAGAVRKHHYTRGIDPELVGSLEEPGPLFNGCPTRIRWSELGTGSVTYKAHMGFKYSLPELSEFAATMRGYLDVFGINMNPSILWNAIPFSFVIDWFLNVGNQLDTFKIENLSPTVTIDSWTESLRISSPGVVEVLDDTTWVPLTGFFKEDYQRWRVPDPVLGLPAQFAGFTSVKTALAASLVGVRLRSSRSRRAMLRSVDFSD